VHAESKISTQSVEQQTRFREEDMLPEGEDDKRLRDNGETQLAKTKSALQEISSSVKYFVTSVKDELSKNCWPHFHKTWWEGL